MGVGSRPKSTGGEHDRPGAAEGRTGFDAIAQYGIGDPDPETGVYAVYDIPEEVIEPKVSLLELVDDWTLVVADFASEYGIRLALAADMTWREFVTLLSGLLSTPESRLYRLHQKNREE